MSASKIRTFLLNDGTRIPAIAWGTGTALYKQDVTNVTALAIKNGLTHLDGAQIYANEDSLGAGIANSGVPRESLYVVTKLTALPAGKTVRDTFIESLQKLKVDYVDLFLIHSPTQHRAPDGKKTLQAVWKALEDLKEEGLTKSIGVSNFMVQDFEDLLETARVVPAVNQIEFHVYLLDATRELLEYSAKKGIVTASYGGLTPLFRKTGGPVDDVLKDIQARHAGGKATQGQLLIKWLIQKGIIAVTTTSKESRMQEIVETESLPDLSPEDIKKIDDAGTGQHHRTFWKDVLN